MAKNGHTTDRLLQNDHMKSLIHQRDKSASSFLKIENFSYLPPKDTNAFQNDFKTITTVDALFFAGFGIPEVRAEGMAMESWDKSGTLASFSAGSEVAAVLKSRRFQGDSGKPFESLPSTHQSTSPELQLSKLVAINQAAFVLSLARLRDEVKIYHQWATGENQRKFWKKRPVSNRAGGADLARYTVTCHPALARAMALILEIHGGKTRILKHMADASADVIAEFQRVTGRMVLGLALDFSNGSPAWHLWHSGVERVIYKAGGSCDQIRYRRTALNLNAGGSRLMNWNRVRRSFQRVGMDFVETCRWTLREYEEADLKCWMRQGRRPGDWVIHETADMALERILLNDGWRDLVDASFMAFVVYEKMRYAEVR